MNVIFSSRTTGLLQATTAERGVFELLDFFSEAEVEEAAFFFFFFSRGDEASLCCGVPVVVRVCAEELCCKDCESPKHTPHCGGTFVVFGGNHHPSRGRRSFCAERAVLEARRPR